MALRITIPATEIDSIAETHLTAALRELGARVYSWPEWHHSKGFIQPSEFRESLVRTLQKDYAEGIPWWLEKVRIEQMR
jgi:hypothetical protein